MKKHFYLLPALALICFTSQPDAEARLGEDFSAFLTRFTKTTISLKPLAQLPGVTTENFTFEVIVPAAQKKVCPDFAAGLTVTVTADKITGESLAFRIGNNSTDGQKMASKYGFDFVYEAIGKPIPTAREKAESEFKAFADAIDSVYLGERQYLRYPGYNALITIRLEPNTGNLLIGVTPTQGDPQTKPANAGKTPSKVLKK